MSLKINHFAKIFFILVFIICLSTFLGCNKSTDKETKKEFESYTVTDLKDRTITINNELNKIMPAYTPAMFFVLALGLSDKIITMVDTKNTFTTDNSLPYKVNPKLADLPKIKGGSGKINIEQVISNKPDILILYPNNYQEVAKQLEEVGILSIVIEPENKEKIKESIMLLGKTFKKETEAQNLINIYDSTIEEIKETIEAYYKNTNFNKTKAYFIDSGILDTISGEMLQSQMITDAQGINITSELTGWKQQISYEELVKKNPDVIIIASYSKTQPEELMNNPQLAEVSAVRNDRIYKMPSNLDPWDFPSPNAVVVGTYWIASKLYPDIISIEMLKNKVNEFYKVVYGKSFDELDGEL